jgi:hypothetical protein
MDAYKSGTANDAGNRKNVRYGHGNSRKETRYNL